MMKYKLLLCAGFISGLPLISFAATIDIVKPIVIKATSTAEVRSDAKEVRKEELKKQLGDTIDTYGAIINTIQNLAKRIADREAILGSGGNLTAESKDKIDSKLAEVAKILATADDRTTTNLARLADILVNTTKTTKPLRDFKNETAKIKIEINSAYKLIMEVIDLIKKEPIKAEGDNVGTTSADTTEGTTTTSN